MSKEKFDWHDGVCKRSVIGNTISNFYEDIQQKKDDLIKEAISRYLKRSDWVIGDLLGRTGCFQHEGSDQVQYTVDGEVVLIMTEGKIVSEGKNAKYDSKYWMIEKDRK